MEGLKEHLSHRAWWNRKKIMKRTSCTWRRYCTWWFCRVHCHNSRAMRKLCCMAWMCFNDCRSYTDSHEWVNNVGGYVIEESRHQEKLWHALGITETPQEHAGCKTWVPAESIQGVGQNMKRSKEWTSSNMAALLHLIDLQGSESLALVDVDLWRVAYGKLYAYRSNTLVMNGLMLVVISLRRNPRGTLAVSTTVQKHTWAYKMLTEALGETLQGVEGHRSYSGTAKHERSWPKLHVHGGAIALDDSTRLIITNSKVMWRLYDIWHEVFHWLKVWQHRSQ